MSDQAFRGDVDHWPEEQLQAELNRLRQENARLQQTTVKPGVVKRPRKRKPFQTFPYKLAHDTTTKGSPQSAYSKAGRWTKGLHADFVSPFPKDQQAYWRRFWREVDIEQD